MQLGRLRWLEGSALAIVVAVRIGGLVSIAQTRFARFPLVDAYTYWDQAKKILAGKNPFPEGFYQPPGYPALLWSLGKITGGVEPDTVRIVHAVLGVLTAFLLIRIGRRLGQSVGAPWAGAVAALLYSLYPTTLLFELDLLTPAVTTVLFIGALVLIAKPGTIRAGMAGLLTGLAAVIHPTYLLGGLALLVWAYFNEKRRLRPAMAVALGLGIAVLPTTTINLVKYKQAALISNNAGINFYIGNNPGWRETAFLRPGLPFRALALEAEPHRRDSFARNDYWMDRAITSIRDAPLAWGGTMLTKCIWSVNNREIPRNEDYRCRTDDGPMAWLAVLPVRYGWVFPFALIGAVVLWRGRRTGKLVGLCWVAMHLPVVLFVVADRYRLATWPLLCLAAPLGAQHLVATLKRWRVNGKRPGWPWLVGVAAAVLPWVPIDQRTAYQPGWCRHVDANLSYMDGDLAEAERLYGETLALDPDDIGARSWLALTMERRGDFAAAQDEMDAVVAAFPTHFPSLKSAARMHDKTGDVRGAADLLVRAYRVPGKRTHTGTLAVKMLVRAGRAAEARALMSDDPKLARHPKLKGVVPGAP